jgi:hypothetical protein
MELNLRLLTCDQRDGIEKFYPKSPSKKKRKNDISIENKKLWNIASNADDEYKVSISI